MRWENFAADQAARLDAEARALRMAQATERAQAEAAAIDLLDRLAPGGEHVRCLVRAGGWVVGQVSGRGADWFTLDDAGTTHLVPIAAVDHLTGARTARLRPRSPLESRLGIGHPLRTMAQTCRDVRVEVTADAASGRIRLVGRDHLVLSTKDAGEWFVPFAALQVVHCPL